MIDVSLKKIVLASRNQEKLKELEAFLVPYGFVVVPISAFSNKEIQETETSFEGNAKLKALEASRISGLPCLADDSGISIEALGGEPGVYTANWAGEPRDYTRAMNRVLSALEGHQNRKAKVVCVLALALPDGQVECVEGVINCTISSSIKGDQGFGYDPILIPEGADFTFAELGPSEKQKISHRTAALRQFVSRFLEKS